MKQKTPYQEARQKADALAAILAPHCERIEIAGSIRREKPEVGDIEIVCIPKRYEVGLFKSGIAAALDGCPVIRGQLGPACRMLCIEWQEMQADLFFATHENWGLQLAVRTGPADYSHQVLAAKWSRHGYKSEGGILYKAGRPTYIPEERDLFDLLSIPYVHPKNRTL